LFLAWCLRAAGGELGDLFSGRGRKRGRKSMRRKGGDGKVGERMREGDH
jgi:hypothetical protein